MLIIFGVRRRGQRLATVFAMCGICHTPAAQAVVGVKTFFSLFFIPVIPLGTKYRSTCTMCGGTIELTKEQADHAAVTMQQQRAQAQAQQPAAFAAPPQQPLSPPPAPPAADQGSGAGEPPGYPAG